MNKGLVARRLPCHGNSPPGQLLFTGSALVIIDFEGEPGCRPDHRPDWVKIPARGIRNIPGRP